MTEIEEQLLKERQKLGAILDTCSDCERVPTMRSGHHKWCKENCDIPAQLKDQRSVVEMLQKRQRQERREQQKWM